MDDREDQRYVQSWIADQARRAQPGSPEHDSHAPRVADHARPWRPQNLPLAAQVINTDRACSPRKRGPEIWDRPILGLPSLSETSNGLSPDNCVDKTFDTTHEASINDGRNLESSVLKEVPFSKRPRRKTHDDRYDKDRHKRQKHSHKKDATQRREHPDEVSQSAKHKSRPGETVLKNFKSPYIHVDNITMPQLTKGIFDNKIVSRREYVVDLDFNHIPLRSEVGSAEIEHRSRVREKDERRRIQRSREEAEIFERAFSGTNQLRKTTQESLGLPPSRGQRSSSVYIADRRHPTASSCDGLSTSNLFESSLIEHVSKIPGPAARSLTVPTSHSRRDTVKADTISDAAFRREPRQVQEQRDISAIQVSDHRHYLQKLIDTGTFDFIDSPFEEARVRRQTAKDRPRQDVVGEPVDRCTHQPIHAGTGEYGRDGPDDGDLSVLHRRLKNLEDTVHPPSLDWRTAPESECGGGVVDRRGHSEAQPTNSDPDQGKDQGMPPMQSSRHQTDSDHHPWQDICESSAPERRQSCTTPAMISLPYRTGNYSTQVDEPCRAKSYVSAHRNREFSHPRESPHIMAHILEETSGQISQSPRRSPDQQDRWSLDSQTLFETERFEPNNYRRPVGESLDDLVKRIDGEILGEPLLRQGLRGHDDCADAGYAASQMSHNVDELPREDWAGFRHVAAPDQPVHSQFSKYDPNYILDDAEDDSELANFWRPQHF